MSLRRLVSVFSSGCFVFLQFEHDCGTTFQMRDEDAAKLLVIRIKEIAGYHQRSNNE